MQGLGHLAVRGNKLLTQMMVHINRHEESEFKETVLIYSTVMILLVTFVL